MNNEEIFERFSDLKLFSKEGFGSVRTLKNECGKPWFVAKDVAGALGLTSGATDAYARLEDSEKAYISPKVLIIDSNDNQNKGRGGSRRPILLISESGMYDMILSSKKESAREFQRWITREVLPSIRENGGYIYGQEKLNEQDKAVVNAVTNDLSNRIDKILEKDIQNLEEKNAYLRTRRRELRREVAGLKEKKKELKDEVSHLKKEVFIRNEDLSDYEEIIEKQARDYDKLLRENKELKGEIPPAVTEEKKKEFFYVDPASGLVFSSKEMILEDDGLVNNQTTSKDADFEEDKEIDEDDYGLD